jgi:PIN domain nuclease of toxin-antitoxin system
VRERVLADTIAVLYALWGDQRLGPLALRCFESADTDVLVSAATLWEIAWKSSFGRLPPVIAPGCANLIETIRTADLAILPITAEDAERAANLPQIHRDPMDRFIIATALREGVPVLTTDRNFSAYGVAVIW